MHAICSKLGFVGHAELRKKLDRNPRWPPKWLPFEKKTAIEPKTTASGTSHASK